MKMEETESMKRIAQFRKRRKMELGKRGLLKSLKLGLSLPSLPDIQPGEPLRDRSGRDQGTKERKSIA